MASSTTSLRVGLVHNWPGAKNSELDIILRILPVLTSLGHQGIIIDPLGQELSEKGDRLSPVFRHNDFDIVLNLHYLNPKLLAGLSYAVNWNPLAYIVDDPITQQPLPIKQFGYIADCFRSHDRILSAGSPLVDNFVASLREEKGKGWLPEASLSLHTSIVTPENLATEDVTAEDARVFYIGVNWEKLSKSENRAVRHEGLFETLDKSGEFVFYGLREQYGVPLWEGIQHYNGELPFDGGKSIIDKSREYGMTLVLSSQQHRDSALVSTRIFQACAAGTVIITDKNPFIERHFGSKVYYFEYGETPKQTAENLLAVVASVKANWQQAKDNARACQAIFLEQFALEKEIAALCDQAQKDMRARQAFIESASPNIHVVVDCRHYGTEAVNQALVQCEAQLLKPGCLHVLCTRKQQQALASVSSMHFDVVVHEHQGPLGGFLVANVDTLGEAFMCFTPEHTWSRDHLFELTVASNNTASSAYSPAFVDYQSLHGVHETLEYGIKGLDGDVTRLSQRMLSRFSAHRLANANILVPTTVLSAVSFAHARIAQFGIGAIFVLLYEAEQLNGRLPVLSAAVTSVWRTDADYGDVTFNQYQVSNEATGLFRDRNMFSAFFAATNSEVAALQQSWELQQEQGFVGSDESADYQVSLLVRQVNALKSKLNSSAFSKEFSLFFYLQHVFRSRPLLLRALNSTHRFFAKLLKV
ncbi:glycosyltransferase family protein [Alteromonas halophila]|uniref:Spore protein YkvP/CgeB glycosyl transferase-like domain-containing protein n=1 Tax=Alteromonas halophila TaxID=516698 RepID=A0A918JKS4_9ALTE|nr:hypothetical protein [Alteromonas halophila]GGW82302.1 hypothetical protein GCM10007391_14170 [Alteromonas halophila]